MNKVVLLFFATLLLSGCNRAGQQERQEDDVTIDLPQLKATGVDGFFVVSAVCSADDPHAAAKELVDTWQQA